MLQKADRTDDLAFFNHIADEVVTDVNMFGAGVVLVVSSKRNSRLVVGMNGGGGGDDGDDGFEDLLDE